MKNYGRLPPGCAANARDLGGYPAEDDGITRYGSTRGYLESCDVSETTSSGIPDRFVE